MPTWKLHTLSPVLKPSDHQTRCQALEVWIRQARSRTKPVRQLTLLMFLLASALVYRRIFLPIGLSRPGSWIPTWVAYLSVGSDLWEGA